MVFLIQRLSDWALAASALGLLFGILAGRSEKTGGLVPWLVLALMLGLGAVADDFGILPGRRGVWLEAGLIILGSYALGGGLGCLAARLFRPRAAQRPTAQDALAAKGEKTTQVEAPVAASAVAVESPAPSPSRDASASAACGAGAEISAPASATLPQVEAPAPGPCEKAEEPWAEQARLFAQGFGLDPDGGGAAPADARDDISVACPPEAIAPQANDALYPGRRPPGTLSPPAAGADDLTRIAGVDDVATSQLQGLGVWTFAQIAAWTGEEARWVEFYLAAPGRAARGKWREQARALAARAGLTG